MTTLIQSGKRSCNASCHYARFSTCRCVCGGLYHGRGVDGSLAGKVHETQDALIDVWEKDGCDVSELKEAKRGALADKLTAEREAWIKRRRGTRTRRSAPTSRTRRSADARQGDFCFSARDAVVGVLHKDAAERLYGTDGIAPDGAEEGDESGGQAEGERERERPGELVDEEAGEDAGGEGGSE
jgi:hypothetical protein